MERHTRGPGGYSPPRPVTGHSNNRPEPGGYQPGTTGMPDAEVRARTAHARAPETITATARARLEAVIREQLNHASAVPSTRILNAATETILAAADQYAATVASVQPRGCGGDR